MSEYKPKIAEAFIYVETSEDIKLFVVIPEGVDAPDSLEFFYKGTNQVREFTQDHAATVVARTAMAMQMKGRTDAPSDT